MTPFSERKLTRIWKKNPKIFIFQTSTAFLTPKECFWPWVSWVIRESIKIPLSKYVVRFWIGGFISEWRPFPHAYPQQLSETGTFSAEHDFEGDLTLRRLNPNPNPWMCAHLYPRLICSQEVKSVGLARTTGESVDPRYHSPATHDPKRPFGIQGVNEIFVKMSNCAQIIALIPKWHKSMIYRR